MNTKINTLAIIVALLAGSHAALANLKWEQTQIELHPALGETKAVGSFKYHNDGSQPVYIKSVRTSCGCTTTSPHKEVIQPGESGEITATFNIGSSTGLQQKTVEVQTDDPKTPATVLTLRAIIPQAVELRPTFVYWQNGDPAKPKTITVKLAKETGAKNLKVTSSSPDFTAKVTSIGANEFSVEVAPRDTSHAASSTLTIQPENGGKPVFATARVVGPGTTSR
ncbi:MAG: DUF1573 domain-containing protein [Verrucomicrobia bacterium]|nr:DUF1573 domain-containing protein [Verrucomicrobiota bacterium]